jgi:hypothetical protein
MMTSAESQTEFFDFKTTVQEICQAEFESLKTQIMSENTIK